MVAYADEWLLVWCLALNAMVFGAGYFFASRRMTANRGQAVLDAALLGYSVQYVSVGIPGMIGALSPLGMSATAAFFSVGLIALAASFPNRRIVRRPEDSIHPGSSSISKTISLGAALFTAAFLLVFVNFQRFLPVMSNDALTYHFPAAARWMQVGRIELFPTWFFNPANTYSPLAGSAFIAWLIAPMGNDLLAKFVEVPALFFAALGVYRLCRELGVELATAALVASAVSICCPLRSQALMGKDDLFVAAFFISAMVAMTPARAAERWGAVRLGIALGLLLATKYTALMTLPLLLLAVDGPWRAGWRWKQYGLSLLVTAMLAGPWYWRNFRATGNPIFPVDVSVVGFHLFRGLFTFSRSDGLCSVHGLLSVLTGGTYGLPKLLCVLLVAAWMVALVRERKSLRANAILRAVLIAPPLAVLLFAWRSPFPEVRFVFPAILLLFTAFAAALPRGAKVAWVGWLMSAMLLVAAFYTTFGDGLWQYYTWMLGAAAMVAVAGCVIARCSTSLRADRRWILFTTSPLVALAIVIYVFWPAYVSQYRQTLYGEGSGWMLQYGDHSPLWQFIDEQIPPDATIAYTNAYLVYPLQGSALRRRVVYAPTRANVHAISDLPWLGDSLSGERLVPATIAATQAQADRNVWLNNLRNASAEYLLVGKNAGADPPEAAFAAGDPSRFHRVFENSIGTVYAIERAGSGE